MYITASELVNQIPTKLQGLLTDDSANGTEPDSDIIAVGIEWAEQIVNSYLASRYSLPVEASDGTVPALIKNAAFILAKYKLHQRRDAVTQQVRMEYEDTLGWLKMVRDGKADIPLLDSSGSVESTPDVSIIAEDVVESDFDNFV